MLAVNLSWYLIAAAALFCIGLYGVLARKNAIGMLMGVELMLNAVNLNLIAFWRYWYSSSTAAEVFVTMVIAAAAAEVAVGLAIIISIYRRKATVVADEVTELKG
jgi:NADH-quinone oxidoreductase subunit K